MEVSFQSQVAVVTGASSGIGRAIALSLASQGAKLCLVGRRLDALETVAALARQTSPQVLTCCGDITEDAAIAALTAEVEQIFGVVDVLVHGAGLVLMGTFATATVEDFDQQYRTNVRAPYLLTQRLLPLLIASQGQIVFINSSVVQRSRPEVGQYAATKQALKAIADSLRMEVNPSQVRVLSVYPGRTATPQQATIHDLEGRPYHPDRLMQPEDIAEAVLGALALPRTAEVTDLFIRPFSAT